MMGGASPLALILAGLLALVLLVIGAGVVYGLYLRLLGANPYTGDRNE